jgi:hypothetical protein
MTTSAAERIAPSELEPDNAARIAIFDAMSEAADERQTALTLDELYHRVIGRLRVLVPRELHIAGERPYLEEKIDVCINAALVAQAADNDGRLRLTGDPPWIRYPDDTIRLYQPGLIAARERLNAVNSKLRERGFDVGEHLPHHERDSPAFRALVRSMREHGFLKQAQVFRFPDGRYVDGYARVAAANEAGVDVKWLDLDKLGEPAATRARRRDTPLNRILLALDSNGTRLSEEDRQAVLNAVADAVDCAWDDIARDLELTQAWRQATASSYTPTFEAEPLPLREGSNGQILVTPDEKVHVASLLRAVGLHKHKFDTELRDWVHYEKARVPGQGPPAVFVRAADLVAGIDEMLADRRTRRRKISPEWNEALAWLRAHIEGAGATSAA